MRFLSCLFILFMPITLICSTSEYIYPIALLDNEKTILYIHQISPTNIKLCEWNSQTKTFNTCLWTLYNPAALQLLYNNSGFSFIDNGRLRIKSFNKRSAKAVDFDEPIFNIHSLEWIDEHNCYCSAQNNDNFSLFQLSDKGVLWCIAHADQHDFMYPQKIDDELFYIERYQTKTSYNYGYRIMKSVYPSQDTLNDINVAEKAQIILTYEYPVTFLDMVSATEGFFLEHAATINTDDRTVEFVYHHIKKKNEKWVTEQLFSFKVPISLLSHSNTLRLYESIMPLLPRIIDNKIYYVDCTMNENYYLEPYLYDIKTADIKKITPKTKKCGHYFVPIVCEGTLYFGGSKSIF